MGNEIITVETDNQRELFVKWMKYLFYIQVVAGVVLVLSAVPAFNMVVAWANRILSVGVMVVLFKLSPLNKRYKKAAIFMCVMVVLNILSDATALTLVASICSLVYSYQEYCGHSEMVEAMDAKLAKNWHSLFNWQIFTGVILGVFGAVAAVVRAIALPIGMEVLVTVVLAVFTGVNLIIWIIYLRYLKRTYTIYSKYEEKSEEL